MLDIDTLLIIFALLPFEDLISARAVCSLWRRIIDNFTRPPARYRAVITWNPRDPQFMRQLITFDAHYRAHKSDDTFAQCSVVRQHVTEQSLLEPIISYLSGGNQLYSVNNATFLQFKSKEIYGTLGRYWLERMIPFIESYPDREHNVPAVMHFVTCYQFMMTNRMRDYHYIILIKRLMKYFTTHYNYMSEAFHWRIIGEAYNLAGNPDAGLSSYLKNVIDDECCEHFINMSNQYIIIEAYHISGMHPDFLGRLCYAYEALCDPDNADDDDDDDDDYDPSNVIDIFCMMLIAHGYANVIEYFREISPENIPVALTIAGTDPFITYITHAHRSAKNRGISLEQSLDELAMHFDTDAEYVFQSICKAYETIFAELRWHNLHHIVHPFALIDKWIDRTDPVIARIIALPIIDGAHYTSADLTHNVTYQLAKHVMQATSH